MLGGVGGVVEPAVQLGRIARRVGERAPRHPRGVGGVEDRRDVPGRVRADERRVLQRGRLAADGEHVPGGGVGPEPEVVIAEGVLFGQPGVERDHRVGVDLHRQRRVVTHRVVHPRVAVMGLVEVRRRRQQITVVRHGGAPGGQRREIEIGGLVLLQEHDHPMPRHRRTADDPRPLPPSPLPAWPASSPRSCPWSWPLCLRACAMPPPSARPVLRRIQHHPRSAIMEEPRDERAPTARRTRPRPGSLPHAWLGTADTSQPQIGAERFGVPS